MADAPSAWIVRWAPLIRPGGSVLDVACGAGRHLRWLAARGLRVTGVDRNPAVLAQAQGAGELIEADIEAGPWPLPGRRFDAVVVTHYLWRALLPTLASSVADGGLLLYETFALGQQRYGKPSNPDFLLRPRELLDAAADLHVLAYEDGVVDDAPQGPRRLQRLAAWRPTAGAAEPPRLAPWPKA